MKWAGDLNNLECARHNTIRQWAAEPIVIRVDYRLQDFPLCVRRKKHATRNHNITGIILQVLSSFPWYS